MATCKSCGAEILWVVMLSGKRMPLDAKPEQRIVLGKDHRGGDTGHILTTYASHFSTCPNAADHRRGR